MQVRVALRVVAVNLVACAGLLEAMALSGYLWRFGTIYYLDRPSRPPVSETPESAIERNRIHPYFGFIGLPSRSSKGAKPHVNDYGFWTDFEYPYFRHGDDEWIVGIFGGSAAARLASFEARRGVLRTKISRQIDVSPDRVTVLNFAQGGFKQPQQLLVYTYFRSIGQDFDIVLNLDGFNEVALAERNSRFGIDVAMPSIEHVRALQEATAKTSTPAGVDRMLEARRQWNRYSRWYNRAWSERAWELTFASGFLFDWIVYRWSQARYFAARAAVAEPGADIANDSWLYLNRAAANGTQPVSDSIVALWADCSRLMHSYASADGALYYHFVQPNQYYPTARHFTEEERRMVLNPRSPYSASVAEGYRRMEAAVADLNAEGVRAEGLFRSLDDLDGPAYLDDCCHLTDEAQLELLEHIGTALARELGAR